MYVEMWPVGRLKPYPQNPRHNDAGVDAVAASLREYGWRQPVVVDEQDVIVVGHTRYKAALKLGMTEVPVHVARGLTPEQARAYRIADNQAATLSAWDDGLLVQELAALQAADFDVALTGFAEDDLLDLLADPPAAATGDPDDVPDPPAAPVTRPGDLWAVGRHRLLCGDATSAADVTRVLGGRPADLLLTDPPYNVAYEGGTAARLTIAKTTSRRTSISSSSPPRSRRPRPTSARAAGSTCGTPTRSASRCGRPWRPPGCGCGSAWCGSSRRSSSAARTTSGATSRACTGGPTGPPTPGSATGRRRRGWSSTSRPGTPTTRQ